MYPSGQSPSLDCFWMLPAWHSSWARACVYFDHKFVWRDCHEADCDWTGGGDVAVRDERAGCRSCGKALCQGSAGYGDGYGWTGFYIGGNVGYSWGRARNSETISDFATGVALFTSTSSNDVNGVIGGGQIGYNWQAQNWLFGLEADIQGSGEKGSRDLVCVACANDGTNITSTLTQKLTWFGTVRGRVGVLVTPSILLYGTGGLAYGELKTGGSITGTNVAGVPVTVAFPGTASTRVGWTAGVGVEGKIAPNWTAKLEYLYMDLGSVSAGPVATTILVPVRAPAGVSYFVGLHR